MQKPKEKVWKTVEIEAATKKKIAKIAFDNDLQYRIVATELIELALTNEKQIKDLVEKLRAE